MHTQSVDIYVSSATQGDTPETWKHNCDITKAMTEMGAARVTIEATVEDLRKSVMARLEEQHPLSKHLLADQGEDIDAIVDQIVCQSDGMFVIARYLLDRKIRNLESLMRVSDAAVREIGVTDPVLFHMRATSEYIGKHLGELSFRKGEIIAVTKADTEYSYSYLWEGIVRGIAGEFPKSLARKIEGVDEDEWQPDKTLGEWKKVLAEIESHRSQSRDTVFTILCWLAHAQDPLTLDDITKALSWDVTAPPGFRLTWGDGGIDIKNFEETESTNEGTPRARTVPVLDLAKNLLHFDNENSAVSVLDSMRLSDAELAVLFPGGHELIARTCLQILMRGSDVKAGANTLTMGNPDLMSYAARHWGDLVQLCRDESIDDLVAELLMAQTDSKRSWIENGFMPFMDVYRVIRTDDETAVLKAARLGLDGVIKLFLRQRSYDLNKPSFRGDTAMSVAVVGGFVSTVKLLYRHGASAESVKVDVDSIDGSVSTESLLQMATRRNDDVMVALLIKLGLFKNTVLGTTSLLETAFSCGSIDVARMLLAHGAELTDQAMRYAAGSRRLELVELALGRPDSDAITTLKERDAAWKSDMLFTAVGSGSIPVVEYMIHTLGASVTDHDPYGNSVVHIAAGRHSIDMVRFLMNNSDDPMLPYRQNSEGYEFRDSQTAVEKAMYFQEEQAWHVVDFLVERMPPDVPGDLILGMAAIALEHERSEYAKRFIRMVAPPLEHTSVTCATSLMGRAVAMDNAEIVGMLLDGSMSAAIPDKNGYTLLHIAAEKNAKEVAELILSRGVGVDINAMTTVGVTPVHAAVSEGHLETIQVLARHGADLSLRAEDGSSALVSAGCSGKLDAAFAILEHNVDVNESNLEGETLLHYAVLDGKEELVRKLLQLSADTSISSRRGGTALHLAAHRGREDVVRFLLDAGAGVESEYRSSGQAYEPQKREFWSAEIPWNRWGITHGDRPRRWCKLEPGWTPLHCAACSGHEEVVRMLLASGADIGAVGDQGETPLHVAASAAHVAIIELLVQHGADIRARTMSGETPLHCAARAAVAVEVKLTADSLKCACRRHKDDAYERTHPDESKAESAELLITLGAAADVANADGATPLMLAVAAGHGDVVQVLFRAAGGAASTTAAYAELLLDIAQREDASAQALAELSASFSETPESQAAWCQVLGNACLTGKFEMAQLAIYKGATLPDSVGPAELDPLHHIVKHDELSKLVDLVLATNCGADVHRRDSTGNNALHLAVAIRGKDPTLTVAHHSDRRARIVAALLDAGSSPNARTPAGDTALHLACAAGDEKVVEALLHRGASVDIRNAALRTPLHAAVSGWAFGEIVKLLLDAGAHHSPRDTEGATPLHLIRETRTSDALELLLEAGADIALPMRSGDHPLHRAVRRGNGTVVNRLIGAGADPSTRGAKGRTCLHIAARHGYAGMLGGLSTSPNALNAVDEAGWTPARHASSRGYSKVLGALLAIGREQGVQILGADVDAVPLNAVGGDKAGPWRLPEDENTASLARVALAS